MIIIEAMKQALEALEELMPTGMATLHLRQSAMIALRQAIKQAEKNDFYPDWNLTEPLFERIAELESQIKKLNK
jgi:hypothetical protein